MILQEFCISTKGLLCYNILVVFWLYHRNYILNHALKNFCSNLQFHQKSCIFTRILYIPPNFRNFNFRHKPGALNPTGQFRYRPNNYCKINYLSDKYQTAKHRSDKSLSDKYWKLTIVQVNIALIYILHISIRQIIIVIVYISHVNIVLIIIVTINITPIYIILLNTNQANISCITIILINIK